MQADIIIAGAGHGGAQCAIALRQNGFTGSILMIGRENEPPYERPPLSKDYLAHEKEFERLLIRPPAFWPEKKIQLISGVAVTTINPEGKTLTLSNGETAQYGTLVWASGGEPRRLSCPGAGLDGVHAIRTRADCDGLMRDIENGVRHITVIGGGYIGLEAAAVLRKNDIMVTLVEALPRVLARVAGAELSAFFEAEHRGHGVDLRTGMSVTALEGAKRVNGVRLDDGTLIETDAVIVGIGIIPAVAPLIAAGATGSNGVDVDEHCRTSLPDIYAIGDCAAFACPWADGARMRVESVQNAHDMASTVARAICGDEKLYRAFPWFWSNQYDLKLQTAGISLGYDTSVLRGDLAERSFSVAYLAKGKIIAIDCVNRIKDYVQGRKLIEAGASVDPVRLADISVALKDMMPGS